MFLVSSIFLFIWFFENFDDLGVLRLLCKWYLLWLWVVIFESILGEFLGCILILDDIWCVVVFFVIILGNVCGELLDGSVVLRFMKDDLLIMFWLIMWLIDFKL